MQKLADYHITYLQLENGVDRSTSLYGYGIEIMEVDAGGEPSEGKRFSCLVVATPQMPCSVPPMQ